jgi:ribulose-5-phosphate 4-epimerase/fuculose-1-phosphate aldolase
MSERINPPAPDGMSAEEWSARLDLAAAYRLGAQMGWSDLLGTHFSVRVPGTADDYLVNPYGLFFEEITASSLIRINTRGEVTGQSAYGVNRAADVIHGGLYAAHPKAQAAIHLHSVVGTGVASQHDGLLPVSQSALMIMSRVRYYEYTGAKLDREECARMADTLGEGQILMLRNHGTLTVGASLGEAFALMMRLERACAIQLAAQASGRVRVIDPVFVEESIRFGGSIYSEQSWSPQASVEWAALRRKIDREDPGYAV